MIDASRNRRRRHRSHVLTYLRISHDRGMSWPSPPLRLVAPVNRIFMACPPGEFSVMSRMQLTAAIGSSCIPTDQVALRLLEGQAFAVVIEETEHNLSAYVPDLPGCVATGPTRDDVLAEIRDAIAFHLEGLADDAQPQPPVRSSVATVLV